MSNHTAARRLASLAAIVLAFALLACDLNALVGSVPTPTPVPTDTPEPPRFIQSSVTAADVTGDNFDPVGITNTFPADQNIFHAVLAIASAPDNTDFKVNWLAADGTQMGSFDLKSGGSRNLDFSFKPDAGKLPPGSYKVAIYVNKVLDRTLTFAVSTVAQARPTGLVGSVTLAKSTQGDDKQPMNPTATYKQSDTFHAVVHIVNAPANTKFNAAWYVIDVGAATEPNTLIDHTELTTDGTRNLDFALTPQSTWPVGQYRVEISVNGTLDSVKQFTVQ